MKDVISVIVVKNVAIRDNVVVVDDIDKAEAIFLNFCRKYLSNFDEYTEDDIDTILDEGYLGFRDGFIAISWAKVVKQ